MKASNFLDLPTDLHLIILTELEPQNLVELAKVSCPAITKKYFHRMINHLVGVDM
jgi:hypothetical protein